MARNMMGSESSMNPHPTMNCHSERTVSRNSSSLTIFSIRLMASSELLANAASAAFRANSSWSRFLCHDALARLLPPAGEAAPHSSRHGPFVLRSSSVELPQLSVRSTADCFPRPHAVFATPYTRSEELACTRRAIITLPCFLQLSLQRLMALRAVKACDVLSGDGFVDLVEVSFVSAHWFSLAFFRYLAFAIGSLILAFFGFRWRVVVNVVLGILG